MHVRENYNFYAHRTCRDLNECAFNARFARSIADDK